MFFDLPPNIFQETKNFFVPIVKKLGVKKLIPAKE